MTDEIVPAELTPVVMPSSLPPIQKISHYVPAATASCQYCRETVVYNLAAGVLQHADPSHDVACVSPWPDVDRSDRTEDT